MSTEWDLKKDLDQAAEPVVKRMRCKDCKHFTRAEKGIKHSCDNPKFVYGDIKEDDQLAYCDYEEYSAGFNVGENFGCIHFEATVK